jgi:hypothetical protein
MAMSSNKDSLEKVLESAAKFQKIVPGAILVGGTAASYYAQHRISVDHDHVLNDMNSRFEIIIDSLQSNDSWINFKEPKKDIVLGSLDGIRTGIRQLRIEKPLETNDVILDNGETLTIPTIEEILRIKAYFIVNRNQVRDYLDVIALTDKIGLDKVTSIHLDIDSYYSDIWKYKNDIKSSLVEKLSVIEPDDFETIAQLKNYKGLNEPYSNWNYIEEKGELIAQKLIQGFSKERPLNKDLPLGPTEDIIIEAGKQAIKEMEDKQDNSIDQDKPKNREDR